nr:hypothetical protein CPGR_00597 [Mycolicibacter nonchromogenicus]
MSKNTTTSATPLNAGIFTTLVIAVYVFARAIAEYWYSPVNTGYSI